MRLNAGYRLTGEDEMSPVSINTLKTTCQTPDEGTGTTLEKDHTVTVRAVMLLYVAITVVILMIIIALLF